MSYKYILDELGIPQKCDDLLQWAKWYEKAKRKIERTTVGGSEISTVFLGLNHNLMGGRPLIYETMVFGGPLDGEMERYSTKEEAVEGHRLMVDRVRNGYSKEEAK